MFATVYNGFIRAKRVAKVYLSAQDPVSFEVLARHQKADHRECKVKPQSAEGQSVKKAPPRCSSLACQAPAKHCTGYQLQIYPYHIQ